MVSKLLLATQETYLCAVENNDPEKLVQALAKAYGDIRKGLGFNKTPDLYGAFPTDPYSHTPAGQGAKQPGMTGQVKEEILTRLAELGLFVRQGRVSFEPLLLDRREHLDHPETFHFLDINGHRQTMDLPAGSLAYTFCQVPVVYYPGPDKKIEIRFANGTSREVAGSSLDADLSLHIFRRNGQVHRITVYLPV